MAVVGNVTSMQIKSANSTGEDQITTITNKRLFVNPSATYQQVDQLARKLINLSTNTYQDTNLITVVSVNEVLAEE